MKEITFRTNAREEMLEITDAVAGLVADTDGEGVCVLFTQHTTCGLTVNENADPDVKSDMLGHLGRLIPQHNKAFAHAEQNSDAHIKSSLVGASASVPFAAGKLLLGRWQGIYLCEFDGPRRRTVLAMLR